MVDSRTRRTKIFISYSHKNDKKHLERLQVHLEPYVRARIFEVWDDTHIRPGKNWKKEIERAIASATVAIFLVSADFFASKFIAASELPPLLEAGRTRGTLILSVIVGACNFSDTELGQLQAVNSPSRPLNSLKGYQREEVWVKVINHIKGTLAPEILNRVAPQTLSAPRNQPEKQKSLTLAATSKTTARQKNPPPSADQTKVRQRIVAQPRNTKPKLKELAPSKVRPAFSQNGRAQIRKESPPPLGAILLTYKGHSGPVYAVSWSHDGKRLASGGVDQTVQVWNAAKGTLLCTYKGHSKQVNSVVWSPQSKRIASCSGGLFTDTNPVQIWNPTSGECTLIYTSQGSFYTVYALAWSPDGRYIAFGGYDNKVQVWDATTDKRVSLCQGHTNTVRTLAWSPDSKRLVSASNDGTVRIWSAITGKHIFTCKGHSDSVLAVAWSPDGVFIASGSVDRTLQIWDATTGDHLFTYKNHSNPVRAVAWSPDSKRLASASRDKTVQIWSVTAGTAPLAYQGHSDDVRAVAWSPDGTRIASASDDGTVQVWSAG